MNVFTSPGEGKALILYSALVLINVYPSPRETEQLSRRPSPSRGEGKVYRKSGDAPRIAPYFLFQNSAVVSSFRDF